MTTASPSRFPIRPLYWLFLAIPIAAALEWTHQAQAVGVRRGLRRDHPARRADGPGDREPRGGDRPQRRRFAQRHLRQRGRTDHRPLRAPQAARSTSSRRASPAPSSATSCSCSASPSSPAVASIAGKRSTAPPPASAPRCSASPSIGLIMPTIYFRPDAAPSRAAEANGDAGVPERGDRRHSRRVYVLSLVFTLVTHRHLFAGPEADTRGARRAAGVVED